MEDTHYYEVNLLWNSSTQGALSSPIITNKVEATSPHEFPNSIKEKWTPEHLFVASITSSLMSTFLIIAENSKFQFISFESNAVGKIERVNGKLSVTEIVLTPILIIPSTQSEVKAKQVLKMSETACDIAHKIKTNITLESTIKVES